MAASTALDGTAAAPVASTPLRNVGGDGGLNGDDRRRGVDPLPGAGHADERDDLGVPQQHVDRPDQLRRVAAEDPGSDRDDHVPAGEHLAGGETAVGGEHLVAQLLQLVEGQGREQLRERTRDVPAGPVDVADQVLGSEPDPGELGLPASHQVRDRREPLRRAGGAGGDLAGPVGVDAALGDRRGRSRRPAWRTAPPPRRGCRRCATGPTGPTARHPASIRVAQLDRPAGARDPAGDGGGVEVLAPHRRVGRLPPAPLVAHLDQVRDQHVIVGGGITRPGRGMAGVGVHQPRRRRRHPGPAASAAEAAGHVVEVGQRGVPFGVHDGVHVLGPADHTQHRHGLVGADHQLHARPPRRRQPHTRRRVRRPARPEDRLVRGVGHDAVQV